MSEYKDQFLKIGVGIIFGLIAYMLASLIFNTTQAMLLGLITLLVVLWTNEALPLGVVSLLPIVLFPMFDIIDTKATAINYANPIIYLFLGGFMLAIGVEKTKLHIYIADKMLDIFPSTPRGMIFSFALTAGLLSSILSNTTTTLLLISIALFITEDVKLKMRFALAVAYGASIGGILTPIGTAPNMILLGIMQEHNLETIAFFQWIWMTLPLVLIMLTSVTFLLSLGLEKKQIPREQSSHTLDKKQKKVLFLLASLGILLLINAQIKPYWSGLGLNESGILLSFGLLLFMPPFNILEWKSDNIKIPYEIIFLFGAGFSIAIAFETIGLADEVASYLLSITHLPPIILLFSVAFLITFTTEITSNTALTSIMLPVIYSVAQQAGINMTLFMMVAAICASYAFMLPIATPPNAIAMSSGVVHVKDMIRYGVVLNLLGIFFIVMIGEYFWRIVL
ncbi:DASS family sodium-coupled anion symporter [Sulfurimonas aquatica]|uniref:DASS family sodium-coupled anion symporter n=1 Tax=Sulfurimonas aquatica TaxID=2672570 RepID=A0A975GCI5_9BACT|nr:DASS family sodium-coupled anion symporter [Sulfurimonas aquatica]QSZ41542.1 DASS family sodium-coupled anion symporter [Sulfurimonas aquatica]